MSSGVTVVKLGGSTLGQHDTSIADLAALHKRGKSIVIVHGGGKTITAWLERASGKAEFIDGLRVTDATGLEVVVAVLAGLVNKQLVAGLRAHGANALGLSGADGGLVQARVADSRLGFVGEVTTVQAEMVRGLLRQGYLPVIAPIAIDASDQGQLLNVNADTVAGEAAAALQAERLVFLTDVAGVLDGKGSVLPHLTREEASRLISQGTAAGGMIPKISACLRAAEAGAAACIIDGRTPQAVIPAVEGRPTGTVFRL
ncbi:MAG: acetylglutamate kinase [Chloroflexi bacterium]|nr:acetylglutamate kinase [Chloroflexota bacterium]